MKRFEHYFCSGDPGKDVLVKISIRNPDHCSVFRSELIAISGALDHALNSYKDSIWILTDSRSSIQYLKNWPKIMDSTGVDILSKLVRLEVIYHETINLMKCFRDIKRKCTVKNLPSDDENVCIPTNADDSGYHHDTDDDEEFRCPEKRIFPEILFQHLRETAE
ncbi:RNase H domain-containing protein [Trichonephila clavipes]|nr:RNase H domain-containing protein [Trichonephila clavipes]